EFSSSIDFIHSRSPGQAWYSPGRKVDLKMATVTRDPGTGKYTVDATTDASPRALAQPGSRELGQTATNLNERSPFGCIFAMDGIIFGLEVCLDHGEHRLIDCPDNNGVQIQLIPSWGMNINRAHCVPKAVVFNVDG